MAYDGKIEISTSKGKVYLTREDGKSWIYDINSGVLFGLRGNPVARFPFSFSVIATTEDDFSHLFWKQACRCSFTINTRFVKSVALLEKIYNIVKDKQLAKHIYDEISYCSGCSDKQMLEYIQYCKENGYIDYKEWGLKLFKIKYKTIFEKYKELPHFNEHTIKELSNFPELAPYYDDILKHWYLNGMRSIKVYNEYTFFNLFRNTIEEMKKYNIPYEYNRNFPLWYSQIQDTIAVRKDLELNNKFLKAKQNMPNLHYSNEKYEVIIPNSIEEYRAEARAMNNCIERAYLEPVVNGKTYIVFIRDKTNINAPLVDCEIMRNGIINQFLKKNNLRLFNNRDEELIDFRREYQNYLTNNIFNK